MSEKKNDAIKVILDILKKDGQKGAIIQCSEDPYYKIVEFSKLSNDELIDYFVAHTVIIKYMDNDKTIEKNFSNYGKTAEEIFKYFEKIADEAKRKNNALRDIPTINHVMANSAMANHLRKDVINQGAYDVIAKNETDNAPQITNFMMVSYDEEESGIKLKCGHVTEYQRQVADAIFTLYLAAEEQGIPPVFTTDMIFKVMPGGSDRATPQQKGAITKAIKFFRHLEIEADITAEYRKRELLTPDDDTLTFDTLYLSYNRVQKKSKNGKTVDAYHFDKKPFILKHCVDTDKLIKVDKKYLSIPKVKSGKITNQPARMTPERQAMTGYLLRRVHTIKKYHEKYKKKNNMSNVILFDTIFKECDITHKSNEQARRNRDFCFDVMKYWKSCGLIKNYKQRHAPGSSHKIDAIVIEF